MGRFWNVEIPLGLAFFGIKLTASVYMNQLIYRICYTIMDYNETQCALLGKASNNETQHLEKLVEPHATVMNMVRSMIENSVNLLMCLFIGPWSDRFGRRPVLIASFTGFTLTYLAMMLFSFFKYLSPWFLVACSLPVMAVGSTPVLQTVIMAYIADSTNQENRGVRLGTFDTVVSAGNLIGTTVSSYIFNATNYTSVFAISASCTFLTLLYVIFFVPESLKTKENEGRAQGFFKLNNLADMIKTTVRRRDHYQRAIMLLCIATIGINTLADDGDTSVTFYFLRAKFGWTLQRYTLYEAMLTIVIIMGTFFGLYVLYKFLKMGESCLMLLANLSFLACILDYGLATRSWQIYMGGSFRFLSGMSSPMIRSVITSIVEPEEIGKVFSAITIFKTLSGLGGSPTYTSIYNATIDTDPALFNLASAGFFGLSTVILIVAVILRRMQPAAVENQKEAEANRKGSEKLENNLSISRDVLETEFPGHTA